MVFAALILSGMGLFIACLALAVRFSPLHELALEREAESNSSQLAVLRFPHLVLGVIALWKIIIAI